jgi:acyl-coenzyme A thioesterase 9
VLSSRKNSFVTIYLHSTRCFHGSRGCRAQAFFAGIASSRMKTPWIDAFHDKDKPRQKATAERDMKPKKMSDSFHRVVIPLGQDKWLSDTYINATGHLR